jgi:endonuclease III
MNEVTILAERPSISARSGGSAMSTDEDARRLVQYIQSLTHFVYHNVDPPYGHIGATIADAVLQANNKYDTNVTPRIQRILKQWPNARTVTAVLELLRSIPAVTFLNWKGRDRADRFTSILHLLQSENVESEADLQTWLTKDANLQKLLAINGVGPKTVDYLKIMVGLQSIAIDRRLLKFFGMAGIAINSGDYDTARDILKGAASLLSVSQADLDHSIWKYVGGEDISPCAPQNKMANENKGKYRNLYYQLYEGITLYVCTNCNSRPIHVKAGAVSSEPCWQCGVVAWRDLTEK